MAHIPSPDLDQGPAFDFDSAFQFGSAFKYARISGTGHEVGEEAAEPCEKQFSWSQKVIRSFILLTTYSALVLTFPVSFWFCVQVKMLLLVSKIDMM